MEVDINKNKNIIKSFFYKNIKILIITLIIIISTIIGCNYSELSQINFLKNTTNTFKDIINQLENNFKNFLPKNKKNNNKENNIYIALNKIKLAKIAVKNNNLINAEKLLKIALSNTKLDNLKNLINIRIARIQLALNKIDQAFITLNLINNKEWIPIIKNIYGDILLKKGDIIGASKAYHESFKLNQSKIMKKILKMKINNLIN